MSRVRIEGGLKNRALVCAGVAPLIFAIGGCSFLNAPAPGVFGNGTPEVDYALCSVFRTECSGWAADGTCPAANLVSNNSFEASLCVSTTNENNQVDATNACKQWCGAALYPLSGDSRATCNTSLVQTLKQTGQCTLATTSPGATTQADCDLGGRECVLAGDGTQSCQEMPFGADHFTPCYDPSISTAETVCENGQQFPPATPGGAPIPDQFPWWRVNLVTPNAAACAQNAPAAVTSFGIDAVTIGTAVAFGETVPLVAKGGFMTTSLHCDSDDEFCSTTVNNLQVQLADISAGGFTVQNPVARLVAPAAGSFGSIPAGGMNLQVEGDLPGLGHAQLVTSAAQPVAISTSGTGVSLTGQLSGFFNTTPQTVAPFKLTLNTSGSTTSPNANCSGQTVQQEFLGFELLQNWIAGQGATVSLTPTLHTQGCFGMQVGGSGYRTVNSSTFATPLAGTTSTLALDVYIPPNQPNPFWLGAVQLYLTCPSAFNNQYIGEAELTGKPVGQFSTVTFPIPGPIESMLQAQNPACFLSMAVNMNQTPTPPVVDNLRFQ